MAESFLITLRETLEASLVVFIILSYLKKINRFEYRKVIYLGVAAALIVSYISAHLFNIFAGGFTGQAEEIFEGVVMVLAAALLTTMILWMARARHVRHQLEAKVEVEISDRHVFGLFAVTFIAVLREGIETVIFLGAASMRSGEGNLAGALAGIFVALGVGYALFYGSKHIELKTFFRVTSTLLIFFAAGLLAHGIHEFQEAGWLPFLSQELWNMNSVLPENGTVGSLLKGVFGYNGNPTGLEVVSYVVYLVAAFWGYRRAGFQKDTKLA